MAEIEIPRIKVVTLPGVREPILHLVRVPLEPIGITAKHVEGKINLVEGKLDAATASMAKATPDRSTSR